MPTNPFTDDELRRQSQITALRDPVSTTMPIDPGRTYGTPQIDYLKDPKNTGVVSPAPSPFQTDLQTRGRSNVGLVNQPPPPGWDAGNWADPNMHSVKYDAGRLLYGRNKPSEIGGIVSGAEFQQRFPGATFDGKDNIDFKGALSDGDSGSPVNLIDVLMAADADTDSSNGIWWGAPDGAAGAPAVSAKAPAGGVNPVSDNSALMKIMAELNATQNGEPSPAEREAMLAMLQGSI